MPGIRVRCHPTDDPNNPDERIIMIDNGLSNLAPPSEHEKIVLRYRRTRDNHIVIDTLECSDGVTWNAPRKHRAPDPVVQAHWVIAAEGIWLVLNDYEISPVTSAWLKPFLNDFTSDIFKFLKWPLNWGDDVDDESGFFK